MHPLVRVNSLVASMTVIIMYELIKISGQLPSITPQHIIDFFGQTLFTTGVSFLGTIGIYTVLFLALRLAIERVRWIKRLALGPAYVEGTWIGYYGTPGGDTHYAIDVYKQTLTATSIRGKGFSATTGEPRATWKSDFVRTDSDLIEFICVVTMFRGPPKINAVTEFHWIGRPGLLKTLFNKCRGKFVAPEIEGTSVNINDVTMIVRMFKFSNNTDWPTPEPFDRITEYHKMISSLRTTRVGGATAVVS